MSRPFFKRVCRRLVRLLCLVFAVEIERAPVNLAESIADRLRDDLTPEQRGLLRRRFGVDAETNTSLEEIAAEFSATRKRIREIEAAALIRLYRWKHRKRLLPAVQRRLVARIAACHETILETLSTAPPIRSVLVEWHDSLVEKRTGSHEIAFLQITGDEEVYGPTEPSEFALARTLRKALWANTRSRRAAHEDTDPPDHDRSKDRGRALEHLRAAHLNARSVGELAEHVLECARLPNSARVEPLTAIAGMLPEDIFEGAETLYVALQKSRRAQQLLFDSAMPMVAEYVVATGARGQQFFTGIETGRAALLEAADLFCFLINEDFSGYAEQAVRQALREGVVEESNR